MKYSYNPLLDKKLQLVSDTLSDLSGLVRGRVTITAGNTGVVVAHGLTSRPYVSIGQSNFVICKVVSDATNITITMDAPQAVDVDIDYIGVI